MKEAIVDQLPKRNFYNLQDLSAVISPVGTDFSKIIKDQGSQISTHQPSIKYFPDGIEVNFTPSYEYRLENGITLYYDPENNFVMINKNNVNGRPIYSLMLPTQGELQYTKQMSYAFFDFTKRPFRIIDPIKDPSPNNIKNFYEQSRLLIGEVQKHLN